MDVSGAMAFATLTHIHRVNTLLGFLMCFRVEVRQECFEIGYDLATVIISLKLSAPSILKQSRREHVFTMKHHSFFHSANMC